MNVHAIILAGGHGKRLWPLSTELHPKQLLRLIDGTTLLEQTIQRLNPLCVAKSCSIMTQQCFAQAIKESCNNLVSEIMCEPCGRNTAPALASFLWQTPLPPETVIIMIPADHFVPDQKLFQKTLLDATNYAASHDELILIGVKPTHAATGYGYIKTESRTCKPYIVQTFHEKPTKLQAEKYIQQDTMYWNSGICVGQIATLKKEFMLHQPTLYASVKESINNLSLYARLPNISLDYALLEKSSKLSLFPYTGEWYDVGNLDTLLSLEQRYGKKSIKLEQIDGENNLALSNKKVFCIGVNNLRIVETQDCILICEQKDVEQVRNINEKISSKSP